jgi:hypothetical protein
LASGRSAALDLDKRLRADPNARFEPLAAAPPELDIVVWKLAGATAEQASERAQQIFTACAARNLHLALVQLPQRWFQPASDRPPASEIVTCLRSVLMKPEHEPWLDRIWKAYSDACNDILK